MDNDKNEVFQRLQQMSREDIVAELRGQGINDLNDLVDESLRRLQGDDVQGYAMEDDDSWGIMICQKYLLIN